jgi:flagellar hook capping protein FlgD
MHSAPLVRLLAVLPTVLLLSPPARAAWPTDPQVNLAPALVPTTIQNHPAVVSDGAGGALFFWEDRRNGTDFDIYAQHITAAGAVAAGWPATGLALCSAAGYQNTPVAISDGTGGAVVAWEDERAGASNADIFAARVTGAGTLAAGWPSNGRQLGADTHDERRPALVADGTGGAVVVWQRSYTPFTDIDVMGARVSGAGAVAWSLPLAAPLANQYLPALATDGAGGAVVAYSDNAAGDFDVKVIHVTSTGVSDWNATLCNAAGDQDLPLVYWDGTGWVVVWEDSRSGPGTIDLYAQRVLSGGVLAQGWSSNGMPVCTAAGTQRLIAVMGDGSVGSIIAWSDYRSLCGSGVYAQHLLASGLVSPGWVADGTPVFTSCGNQTLTGAAPDGSGGAILTWYDDRNGVSFGEDAYAARITAQGIIPPGWSGNGTPVSIAAARQFSPVAAPDGNGGAILAWVDTRNNSNGAIYAQTVDHFGQLGDARPAIASIRDIAGDEGGHVRLTWNRSYLDTDPQYGVASYWIWRQAPIAAAEAAVRRGAQWLDGALAGRAVRMAGADWAALAGRGLYERTSLNGIEYAWEYLASQPASGFAQYSYVAGTTRDSLPSGNPYTLFMVEARGTTAGTYWASAPDSGYSVDNLPPLPPAPFTAVYVAGATHLHWGANGESDLGGYRLYRGSSAAFVPAAANRIADQVDTGYVDAGPAGSWYKLSAVDVHGNESVFAVLGPSGTTGAPGGAVPRDLALGPPSPNPLRTGTRLALALPRAAAVRLVIYDVAGRRVRAFPTMHLGAGAHAVEWDGRDGEGVSVASGLYLVRVEVAGRSLQRRILVQR